MSVHFDQKRNKFIARATINGKRVYLGQRDTQYEAEYLVQQTKQLFAEPKQSFEQYFVPGLECNIERPTRLQRIKSFFFKGL